MLSNVTIIKNKKLIRDNYSIELVGQSNEYFVFDIFVKCELFDFFLDMRGDVKYKHFKKIYNIIRSYDNRVIGEYHFSDKSIPKIKFKKFDFWDDVASKVYEDSDSVEKIIKRIGFIVEYIKEVDNYKGGFTLYISKTIATLIT